MKRLFLLMFGLATIACGAQTQPKYTNTKPVAADVFYGEIPSELDFAGERVPLEYPDVREALQREISVTMFMHSSSLRNLRATERVFAVIVPILKQHGVPEDFKYLAMAESGLNPEAVSRVGASGLWQIMKGTARDLGVETGDNVDLRFEIETATHAAAKYLLKAYDKYKNWTLVAASYNLGMAGVTRRADIQMVDSYYDLFLPEETARYVYRILAMKLVSEDPIKYGFKLKDSDYQKPFENYTLEKVNSKDIEWSQFAKDRGTTYKSLRLLNPWIRSYSYKNGSGITYTVKVPKENFRIKGF